MRKSAAAARESLTAETVRRKLSYDPLTGVFVWREKPNQALSVGDTAGSVGLDGYRMICIDSCHLGAHRLAWIYMTGSWPINQIDHRDSDKANNRWSNLRPATSTQNSQNRSTPKTNTSGVKGVTWTRGRWLAQIKVGGRTKHLGYFDAIEDAAAAYSTAASRICGEFARTA